MFKTLKLIFPAIIPSWRFFSSVAPSPRVEYALCPDTLTAPQQWQEFRPRPDQLSFAVMLQRMLWNPQWNETLFLVSCAERLIAAPTQHSIDEIRKRIARDLMRSPTPPAPAAVLHFRLVFLDRVGTDIVKTVEYESSGIEVSRGLRL